MSDEQLRALVDLARAAVDPAGGFGWLDDEGRRDPARPVHLWITCRMTHVAALEQLRTGDEGAGELVAHGLDALEGRLHDARHGGWLAAVGPDGAVDDAKEAYGHAFVLLAATSAMAAGHERAEELADEALAVVSERFWDDDAGLALDRWDAAFEELDDYRGLNATMHLVEALLAVHDVTQESLPLTRAARATERVLLDLGPAHGHRLPEHYDTDWRPLLDHHRDQPDHPFQPYGVTTGHLLEWARLGLGVRLALHRAGDAGAGERGRALLDAAVASYDVAVREGWQVDGQPGFVYTTDFDGVPVVRARMHWVVAEAMAAATALADATGDARYREDHARWTAYAEEHLVDRVRGSWRHELDERNRPAAGTWSGRPDVYHAYQALLAPSLGPVASYAGGLLRARGA